MKIKVNIVLGFLNSGKTTLINLFLESGEIAEESVVIIQYEDGEEKIIKKSNNVYVLYRKVSNHFDKELLNFILREYMPDRIIIEYSSIGKTNEFIDSFNSKYISKICRINRIITVINMRRAALYFLNLKNKVADQIENSHVVVLNNLFFTDKVLVKTVKRQIFKLNKYTRIIEFSDKECEKKSIENRKLCLDTCDEELNKEEIFILIFIIIFLTAIILYLPISDVLSMYVFNREV